MKKPTRRTIVLVILLAIPLTLLVAWKVTMWKEFPSTVQGTLAKGDPSVSPTTWYNHWYMAKWGWKTVTVFEVSEEAAENGYDIGYKPFEGKTRVEGKTNHERRFRMKNGFEDCTFFAIDKDGKEVPLTVVARTTKDDATYEDAPLH